MGPYTGGQAEYLRVPFADFNCLVLPPGDEHENGFAVVDRTDGAGADKGIDAVGYQATVAEGEEQPAYERFDRREEGYSKVVLKP